MNERTAKRLFFQVANVEEERQQWSNPIEFLLSCIAMSVGNNCHEWPNLLWNTWDILFQMFDAQARWVLATCGGSRTRRTRTAAEPSSSPILWWAVDNAPCALNDAVNNEKWIMAQPKAHQTQGLSAFTRVTHVKFCHMSIKNQLQDLDQTSASKSRPKFSLKVTKIQL